jgi:hypothetical protein
LSDTQTVPDVQNGSISRAGNSNSTRHRLITRAVHSIKKHPTELISSNKKSGHKSHFFSRPHRMGVTGNINRNQYR